MTGQAWNKGDNFKAINPITPLKDILIENSTFTNSNRLRIRLLNEGVKEYKCESCNNSIWLNNKIPLELHHINGNKRDNRIENL